MRAARLAVLRRLVLRSAILRSAILLPAALALCGFDDPRDCALGIAHHDCLPRGAPWAAFPQDDAVCRGYGLVLGTRDYALCRLAKRHVRTLTERETDYGFLLDPLTPGVR